MSMGKQGNYPIYDNLVNKYKIYNDYRMYIVWDTHYGTFVTKPKEWG